MDDFPDIPEFLRVTPEIAARRKAWWIAHPPGPPTAGLIFSTRPCEEEPATKALREAVEERERRKTAAGLAELAAWKAERAVEKAELAAVRAEAEAAHKTFLKSIEKSDGAVNCTTSQDSVRKHTSKKPRGPNARKTTGKTCGKRAASKRGAARGRSR